MSVIGFCTVTIPAANVTAGPHSHFPVLIDNNIITDAAFYNAVTAAGGSTYIHAYDTNTAGTEYDRENVVFGDTPDLLSLHVRVPTLSSVSDNVICVAVETTSRANDTTTWTTGGYFCVYHLQEVSGTAVDSCGLYNGTVSGCTYGATGKIQKGYDFDGNNDNISAGNITQENSVANLTWTMWAKQDVLDLLDILHIKNVDATHRLSFRTETTGDMRWYVGAAANFVKITDYSLVVTAGVFFHAASWFNGAGTGNLGRAGIIINGVERADGSVGTIPATTPNLAAASSIIGNSTATFDGVLDEVRGNSNTLSAGWLATEYSNQNAPGSFASSGAYTLGSITITGTIDFTLPILQSGFNGTRIIAGELEILLPILQADINGTRILTGELDAALPILQSGFNGARILTGELDSTLPILQADINGIKIISGSLDALLPLIQSDINGTKIVVGSLDAILPIIQSDINGVKIIIGTLDCILPLIGIDIEGTITSGEIMSVGTRLNYIQEPPRIIFYITDNMAYRYKTRRRIPLMI